MGFTQNKIKNQGFTIVELLIVVVVIAILAAITIVSYNGITNRANGSAAASMAAGVQKKAELFAADGPTSQYPRALSDLTAGTAGTTAILTASPAKTTASSDTWYVSPASTKNTTAPNVAPTSANGKDTIQFQVCGTGASTTAPVTTATITNATGNIISFYNFEAGTGVKTVNVGQVSGTVGSNNVGCSAAS